MRVLSLFTVVAVIISAIFAIFLFSHSGLYVIGGDYLVQKGQTVNGDLYVLFADVTVERDAQINGRVISLCSDVDLEGTPTEKVLAWDFFGYTVLVPKLTHVQIVR
jgi:hypothetical protein